MQMKDKAWDSQEHQKDAVLNAGGTPEMSAQLLK